jgi:hypothetical protein
LLAANAGGACEVDVLSAERSGAVIRSSDDRMLGSSGGRSARWSAWLWECLLPEPPRAVAAASLALRPPPWPCTPLRGGLRLRLVLALRLRVLRLLLRLLPLPMDSLPLSLPALRLHAWRDARFDAEPVASMRPRCRSSREEAPAALLLLPCSRPALLLARLPDPGTAAASSRPPWLLRDCFPPLLGAA